MGNLYSSLDKFCGLCKTFIPITLEDHMENEESGLLFCGYCVRHQYFQIQLLLNKLAKKTKETA